MCKEVGDGPNPRVFNWSYRGWAFREINSGRRANAVPAISCVPRRDFAGQGRLVASAISQEGAQGGSRRFRVAGWDFTIPMAFTPEISNDLHNPILVLHAEAPHFAPLADELGCNQACAWTRKPG